MARKRQQIYVVPPGGYRYVNKYGFGDFMNRVAGNPDSNGNLTSGLFKGMSSGAASGLGAAAQAVGGLAGGLIGGGLESGAGSVIDGLSNVASAIPGPWGAVAGAGLKVVGGLVNRMFGSKLNKENIQAVEGNIGNMANFQTNAGDFDSLTQTIMNQPASMHFNKKFIGKDGWFSNKAKKKFNALREQQDAAAQFVNNSIDNNLENITTTQAQDLAANFAAYGGPLYMTGNGIMSPFGNRFSKGGTLEGPLHSYGADWTNGLVFVNNGNTHESNPFEGVQMGVDEQGTPNLVEEGEVIWNDYVFSNRMRVPKAVREKYRLRGKKDLTFADAVSKVQKESEERPNDPISQRGLDDILTKLAVAQESQREKMNSRRNRRLYSEGGSINIKPNKRGTFTAAATKHGMGVQEFASKVLANKEDYSPAMVKKANFARNAAKWHSDGGLLGNRYDLGSWLDGEYGGYIFPLVDNTTPYNTTPPLLEGQTFSKPSVAAPKPRVSVWDSFNNNLTVGNPIKVKKDTKDEALGAPVINWINTLYKYNGKQGDYNRLLGYMYGDNVPAEYANDPARLIADAGLAKNRHIYNSLMTAYGNPVLSSDKKQVYYTNDKGERVPDYAIGDFRRNILLNTNGELADNLGPKLPTITLPDNKSIKASASRALNTSGVYDDNDNYSSSWLTGLRYVPALGAGLNVFTDLMGWTNKPDYSNADAVLQASRGVRDVKFNPIGDYMRYTPLDRMFYLNQLNANAGASRRNILNTSGGNRGAAMAGLLASDYGTMNQVGQLARQAEEYNLGMRQKVADFNRATNMFNSEGSLKAQQANQGAAEVRMRAAQAAAQLRDAVDARVGAARSANLTNLFESIGDIGREEFTRNMINSNRGQYYTIGRDGVIHYKSSFYNQSLENQNELRKQAERDRNAYNRKRAEGGFITIKRRR